jgi:hypothetical protein
VADETTTVCERVGTTAPGEAKARRVPSQRLTGVLPSASTTYLYSTMASAPTKTGLGRKCSGKLRVGEGEKRAHGTKKTEEVKILGCSHSSASGPPLPSPVCRALEGDGLGNVPVACRSKRWVVDTSEGAVGAAGAESAHQKNGTLNARRTERRDGADDGDALARVHRGSNAEGHAAEKGGRGGCEARSGLVRGEGIHAPAKNKRTRTCVLTTASSAARRWAQGRRWCSKSGCAGAHSLSQCVCAWCLSEAREEVFCARTISPRSHIFPPALSPPPRPSLTPLPR